MNRSLYTLLFHLALPIIFIRLWLRGRQAPAYRGRIAERFGLNLPVFRQKGIWVHAVSVGESIAAAPMIRALMARYPELPMTVTCMTPTGSERIRALFGDQVQHVYLPYDLPWAVGRLVKALKPNVLIVMETELWPNLVNQCHKQGVPVALANGRLSERSAKGYARFSKLTAPMLKHMSLLAVQTQVEAERFIALGAKPQAVTVTGSIKFDIQIDPSLIAQARTQREQWGASARPVWIAASTHAGEDEIVLNAHRALVERFPDALLILVPRHPERFNQVFALCQQRFNTARRSQGEVVTAQTQVLLGDTMGELLFMYALSDIALVGGSFVPNGGHNYLEPAALGMPVLSGPHVFNFLEISAQLSGAGALRILEDEKALVRTLNELFAHPDLKRQMGEQGLSVLKANQGALNRLLADVEAIINRR